MRSAILVFAALSLSLGTITAQADDSATTTSGAALILVSGGCGIGYHRGAAGFCRPNGFRSGRVFYGIGSGRHRTTATGGNPGGYSDRN